MKEKFYSPKKIMEHKAQYNIIFGERSNGKTYSILKLGLENYLKTGKQLGILRRWADDFTGKRGQTMFNGIIANGEVSRLTKGKWDTIHYYASKWFLAVTIDGKVVKDETPFAYGFSLSSVEHDKSTAYPDITTILFDEFITRTFYMNDEFIIFMNALSTIIRDRRDVTIFMCGNTVNKYCPYFKEMGLSHIKEMKQGTIDVYQYGDTDLKVAVEYAKPNTAGKQSDVYFAFDNPKLHMITKGTWEIDIYPHLPCKYLPKEIMLTYFIVFDNIILQCEIISKPDFIFTYIHLKTTELKDTENDLIYSREYSPRWNWRRNMLTPQFEVEHIIYNQFKAEKVFYQDNEVGEVVRNYIIWCSKNRGH